jgi:hypothetical protein
MESTNKAAVSSQFLFLGFACRSGFELCGWKSAWSHLESAVEPWLTHFDHTVSFTVLAQFILESFRCSRRLISDMPKSTHSLLKSVVHTEMVTKTVPYAQRNVTWHLFSLSTDGGLIPHRIISNSFTTNYCFDELRILYLWQRKYQKLQTAFSNCCWKKNLIMLYVQMRCKV